ncbi:MAG: hypothetical protein AB7N71_05645 [Phycisphaerae bacterium]
METHDDAGCFCEAFYTPAPSTSVDRKIDCGAVYAVELAAVVPATFAFSRDFVLQQNPPPCNQIPLYTPLLN